MSAWAAAPPQPKASFSSIVAEEAAEAGDEALQAALAASREAAGPPEMDAELARALEASLLEAAPPGGSSEAEDASLALALALEDEEESSRARRWAAAERARRAASLRHEKVRVGYDDDSFDFGPRAEAPGGDDDGDVVGSALAAEGVEVGGHLGVGLIGRRADGSLVSKHDARLDGAIKARSLESRVDGAGDLRRERVPAKCYHDLVAAQKRSDQRQRPRARTGGHDGGQQTQQRGRTTNDAPEERGVPGVADDPDGGPGAVAASASLGIDDADI